MADKPTKTTVVLNDFGGGTLERRSRTSASGKTTDRYTITMDAQPFALNFDTKELGAPVAQAIQNHLQRRIGDISAVAKPATLAKRKAEEKAFNAGKSWAVRRFSGGRIGSTPPNQSDRLFNNSGRLVRSLVANPTKDNNWVINVAANRLNAAMLGSESALQRIIERLRQFVPEFGDAHQLTTVLDVRRAIKEAARNIYVSKGNPRLREFTKGLIQTVIKSVVNM